MEKHQDVKLDLDVEKTTNMTEHNENVLSTSPTPDTPNPFDYEKLSYGSNGLKGLLESPYVLGAAFLASMGGFSFGYGKKTSISSPKVNIVALTSNDADQGVVSLILTMPQFHATFPQTAPGHARQSFYTGFATAMLELGAFFGCLFYPAFADRFSRKWGLSFAVVFFVVGAIIQTAANNYAELVVGRTIGGIGVGTLAMGMFDPAVP